MLDFFYIPEKAVWEIIPMLGERILFKAEGVRRTEFRERGVSQGHGEQFMSLCGTVIFSSMFSVVL